MKNLAVVFIVILFSISAFAQTPRPTRRPISATKTAVNEKEAFDKAVALPNAGERIAALQKFIKDFPKSEEKTRVAELIFVARATLADEKLRSKNAAASIELFKLAVAELPKPASDSFFSAVLLQIPNGLYFRGERDAAGGIARLLEDKAEGNAKQILALTTFYFATENAAEAKRLADKAIALEPNLPAGYQAAGIADRMNFDFEAAAASYSKALELDAASLVSKRNLAEMKRALGKPLEAIALYREILSANQTDGATKTGLVLALFETGNRSEAETEMEKLLAENPSNLPLLVGAAYWYAAQQEAAKAIEYAQKAIIAEPRYTWAHIALARGLTIEKRLPEAERTLLTARRYGNFPTLDYELASVRLAAGFYREAAEELRETFAIKDNLVTTQLGRRLASSGKSFTELLAPERRAGIFQFAAADTTENAERLKSLLDLIQKLDQAATDDATIAAAADEFVKGSDKMKTHRQLFAAQQLLQRKKAFPKVYELTKAAIGGVEAGLDVPNAAAAVLAEELYENRKYAVSKGEVILVPEVSRQTLSNILRGRIEDITGTALLEENKPADAVIRLKRAVSILPEKSAWWRNSMWQLGTALEADGKSKDALTAYVKSYTNGKADAVRYATVEALYQKVNGNTDGLESAIGTKPAPIVVSTPAQASVEKTNLPIETPESKPPTVTDTAPTVVITNQTTESPVNTAVVPKIEVKTEDTLPNEKKIETKLPEKINDQSVENKSKSIFEPIIINVPRVEPSKKNVDENAEKRPRVAGEKEASRTCRLTVAEESVSIARSGEGTVIRVDFEGEIQAENIKAKTSSSGDVEVKVQPVGDDSQNSIFFLIKSISRKTGTYLVTFEAACGTKEISVQVR